MAETTLGSFAAYRQMTTEVRDDLLKLQNYSETMKLTQNAASIDEVLKKSADDSFDVAVIGEFKRGKSTLINALLERDVLPTDAMPATATLNRVTYSIKPYAEIEYRDGRKEEIEIEKLAEYVTKLTEESEQRAATVKMATVYYPTNYCKNNVDIIDTPGLNDDSAMAEVTLSVLPTIDAALFVIMAQSPFSEYERDFLENKLMTSDLGRILFVVTGIDRLDEDDVDRVIQSITERINKYVIQKAKKLYGEGSPEYEVYRQKLGTPRVFGLSAKQALKGKLKGDNALLERSCFPAFERELERFLTEDRGAITLQVQVNKILAAASEIVKTVKLRESALSMGEEEFKEKYENAKAKIAEIRAHREEEYQKTDDSADKLLTDLRPMISSFWDELTQDAVAVIDSEPISKEDTKKDKVAETQERIMKKVQKTTEDKARLLTERIQLKITDALGREAERLLDFEGAFFNGVDDIQQSFQTTGSSSITDPQSLKDMAIGTGAGLLLGGGLGSGIFVGYRAGGVKGALLGGAVGLGGALGVTLLAGALAIPVTWPIFILATVVGTLGSKFAVNKFIIGDVTEKFRGQLRDAVKKHYTELAQKNDLEKTVREQIGTAFGNLKAKINSETETILRDLEGTLAGLEREIVQKQVLEAKEKEELGEMVADISEIAGRADELRHKLTEILER
ncbi:MAG: hypothetical protein GX628_09365 [Clostridiales bacterium]|nr:hypothetical protein [Clostridiales bacterium]